MPWPGRAYYDRDTGEELDVVGRVVPIEDVEAALGGREPALLQPLRPALPEGPQRLPDLRSPDGTAGLLTVMARRPATACSIALLALATVGLSACGGGDGSSDKPPKNPPALAPPASYNIESAARTTSTTDTTDTTATTPTVASGASSSDGSSSSSSSGGSPSGGTTTPATPAPSNSGGVSANTTPAAGTTPNSGAGGGAQFDQFCQQNPGSC
jgi:hypothetical protein